MTGTWNLGPARPWVYLLLFGALFAAGCSTSNDNPGLNLVDAQGNHPAGFLSTHPGFAVSDISQCTSCHGSDLAGGIAKTSCFLSACHHGTKPNWADPAQHGASAKRAPGASGFASCQICHGNDFAGGGSDVSCFTCHVTAPHPVAPWRTLGGTTHVNTDPANAPVCAACHFPGSPNNPAGHPDPAAPAPAGTPPGCFNNTLCHAGGAGANHAVPFVDNTHFQATQTTFDNDCSNCHSVTGTSPLPAAPLCTVCHTAGSPLTLTSCTSCHANPPAGAAYPDIAGAHATHIALNNGAGTPVTCNTCHNGLGSNTLNHYNRANGRPGAGGRIPPGDAAFLATYNAQSGATTFDNVALSCSNVSCHGGVARTQGTPGTPLNWRTGTLDVNTQCTSCHASGAPQFNSNSSGEHNQGAHVALGCLVCHNTTALAVNHFTALSTPEITRADTLATIGGAGTNVITYVPGGTPGTGSCTPVCHNTRNW
jgi:predicted CxxxxCH...CXXCH cytochrome family protein